MNLPLSGIDIVNVLITGANGFIGKNLQLHFRGRQDIHVLTFTRDHNVSELEATLQEVDFIFHLAGSNRPLNPAEFALDNTILTQELCNAVASVSKKPTRNLQLSSPHPLKLATIMHMVTASGPLKKL